MRSRKTKKMSYVRRLKRNFITLQDEHDLADLLETELYKLRLMAQRPHYRIFSVPKKNGKKRWIEDPPPPLKEVQKSLNRYLQATYFFMRSDAAYGFILGVKDDPNPRNILTNAQQHLGRAWLFNADFQDFFHQVKKARVYQIFVAPPFDFSEDLAELIAGLCTHQERLPMGTPTSPVLSNFATLHLDQELLNLSRWAGWAYTRYADDLSFSAHQKTLFRFFSCR